MGTIEKYVQDLRRANEKSGEEKMQKIKGTYCLDDEISSGRIQAEKNQEKLEKPNVGIVHNFGFSDTFGVLDFSLGNQTHPCQGYYISDSACELGIITAEVSLLKMAFYEGKIYVF